MYSAIELSKFALCLLVLSFVSDFLDLALILDKYIY